MKVKFIYIALLMSLAMSNSILAQLGQLQKGDSLFIFSYDNKQITLIDTINLSFFKHDYSIVQNNLILLARIGDRSYKINFYDSSAQGMLFRWELFLPSSKCKELNINRLILSVEGDMIVIFDYGSFKLVKRENIRDFFF